MLRNIVRTSRWLARGQINNFAPVVLRQLAVIKPVKTGDTIIRRQFTSSSSSADNLQPDQIDQVVFEGICNETLESLCDYFEELIDDAPNLKGADVTYSDGVLTVALGSTYGTYVINRQTPNKQIWLSSPVSGPKRYDLILKDGGYWTYKHDGIPLHKLLQEELGKIVKSKVKFNKCAHSSV